MFREDIAHRPDFGNAAPAGKGKVFAVRVQRVAADRVLLGDGGAEWRVFARPCVHEIRRSVIMQALSKIADES